LAQHSSLKEIITHLLVMESKSIQGKTIAILIADGVNDYLFNITKHALEAEGASTRVIAMKAGSISAVKNKSIPVDHTVTSTTSDAFDALYIPGGKKSVEYLSSQKEALHFVCSMYSAGKNIAVDDEGIQLLEAACLNSKLSSLTSNELKANGIFIHSNAIPIVKHFVKAIAADHKLPDYSKEESTYKVMMR
jgi:catalase